MSLLTYKQKSIMKQRQQKIYYFFHENFIRKRHSLKTHRNNYSELSPIRIMSCAWIIYKNVPWPGQKKKKYKTKSGRYYVKKKEKPNKRHFNQNLNLFSIKSPKNVLRRVDLWWCDFWGWTNFKEKFHKIFNFFLLFVLI